MTPTQADRSVKAHEMVMSGALRWEIADEMGVSRAAVNDLLDAVRVWDEGQCCDCRARMRYRVLVNQTWRLKRCYRCAAEKWQALRIKTRTDTRERDGGE